MQTNPQLPIIMQQQNIYFYFNNNLIFNFINIRIPQKIYPVKKLLRDFPGGPVVRLCIPNAESLGSMPDQGTRSHRPQLTVHMAQPADPACCDEDQRS